MSDNDIDVKLYPGEDLMEQLIDNVAILAMEAQAQFAEIYGDYAWRADLTEPAVFWFEREPPAMFAPSFIGSTSGVSNTWLWGWENINGFPHAVVEDAERLHEIAESFTTMNPNLDCVELLTPNLPLSAEERHGMGLRDRDEYSYVYAAMAVAGMEVPVYYRGPTGEGSYAWFLLHNPQEFSLPSATPLATATALTEALNRGLLTNHKVALEAYAARRAGIDMTMADDVATLETPAGTLTVTFDEFGRIGRISSTLSPEQTPAANPEATPPPRPQGFFGKMFGKRH